MIKKSKLKILFVSAEVSPYAKTGGLADVAGSLPQTLADMGNDVRIVMPKYKVIKSPMSYVTDLPVQVDSRKVTCVIRETEMNISATGERAKVPVYFLDNYHYYDREGIYCYFDDAERYIFFCKAVLEMLPKLDFKPDIIHCNDWHTGPICMLLKEQYKKHPFYADIATLFTVHNLEYQGNFQKDVLKFFNMGEEIFTADKVEFYGMFSFMKAGLVYADIINTVSQKYAREIRTQQYGEKLEGLLKRRTSDLYGIVNGISYDTFCPEKDTRIYKNYNADTFMLKKENKFLLQKEAGLPVKDVPLIAVITRLTGQKGLNLILDELDEMMKDDIQFIVLGEGDEFYESAFNNVKAKYPDKVAVFIEFNATLAQKIYAASDMFLMPSRFEPCGLGQIISLRYGTIPVVRATGGLAETVLDYEEDKINGNGFSFTDFSSKAFIETYKRAINIYNNEPEIWNKLVLKALKSDFSWNTPAKKYIELYNLAIEKV